MRFASFAHDGRDRFGVVTDDGIADLTGHEGHATLASVIAAEALDAFGGAASSAPVVPFEALAFRPTIPAPGKIVCIGVNYEPHRIEMGREKGDYPMVFTRMNDTLVAHADALTKPANSDAFDYEGEIAIVIGKPGRHIAQSDAMEHVAGYTIFMDASVRDFQQHNLIAGKNFPGTGGMGPWMTVAAAMPAPEAVTLETRLNGSVMQEGTLSELTFSIPELIAYVSAWTPLSPGDVISTGTPGGVGTARTPPVYMRPGDRVAVEVAGIGTLEHTVAAEA